MVKKVKDKGRNAARTSEKKVKNSYNVLTISAILVSILISVISYQVYVNYLVVPEMPQVDLNTWWGPNTTTAEDKSIRPFRVLFTEAMQEQLRRKFEVYRANLHRKKSLTENSTYGINSVVFGQVFAHWQFKYTYREQERYLNKFDHFKTNIQGLDMHFIHVKPRVDNNIKVLPLLLLHGWPGSVRDFYEVIPLLTTIRPGYDFVFEVIVPSLPGFIYSQAPVKPGLAPYQIAVIMSNLMHRLGFHQYFVQGGDFGHAIGSHMATIFPQEVLGFHTSFPVNFSKLAVLTTVLGAIWPKLMGEHWDRMYPLKDKVEFYLEESGYLHLQGTKPDTIGIALQDSPVGLAAYLMDRYLVFTDPEFKLLEDGGLSKVSLPALIDNVMLYWSTGSITTALRLYKESFRSYEVEQVLAQIPTKTPTWGLRLKHELMYQPDCILRWKYPALVGTTTLDVGGHFAAVEKPQELADDVFLGVKEMLRVDREYLV